VLTILKRLNILTTTALTLLDMITTLQLYKKRIVGLSTLLKGNLTLSISIITIAFKTLTLYNLSYYYYNFNPRLRA